MLVTFFISPCFCSCFLFSLDNFNLLDTGCWWRKVGCGGSLWDLFTSVPCSSSTVLSNTVSCAGTRTRFRYYILAKKLLIIIRFGAFLPQQIIHWYVLPFLILWYLFMQLAGLYVNKNCAVKIKYSTVYEYSSSLTISQFSLQTL